MADLNNATYWSETDASNNSASPNGWPEGMMPSGVNDAARSDKGALKRFWDRINPLQTIGSSGGVWTFTTANPSYPASYVDGEIYAFTVASASQVGDQFRVNALPPKPIYILRGLVYDPIGLYDMVNGRCVRLIYNGGLAAGAGGFMLIDPWIPVWNVSGGAAATYGNLTVGGALTTGSSLSVGTSASIGGNANIGGNLTVNASGTGIYAPNGSIVSGQSVYAGSGSTTRLFNDGTSAGLIFAGNYGWFQALSTGILSYVNNSGTRVFNIDPSGNVSTNGSLSGASLNVSGGAAFGGGATINAGVTINAGGTALSLPSGGITVGSTGITYSSYEGHAIAFGWNGTNVIVHVDGTNQGGIVTISGGNAGISGTLTAGTVNANSGNFASVVASGGGIALNAPSGNLSVGGTGYFGSTLAAIGAFSAPSATFNGAGTALNVSAGNATIAGTLGVTGTFNANANVGIFGAGGAALQLVNGGMTVAGASSLNGGIVLPANVTMTGGTGTFFNNGIGQWAQRDDIHGFQSRTGGVQFAYFDATGTHNISGAWLTGSDASLKQDVAPFTARGLAAVRALNPVTFRYRPGTPFHVEGARPLLGLIADEVKPLVPEIVGEMTATIDGEERTLGTLQPSNLVYVLIRAMQELADKVDALTGEPHVADGPTPEPRPHRR